MVTCQIGSDQSSFRRLFVKTNMNSGCFKSGVEGRVSSKGNTAGGAVRMDACLLDFNGPSCESLQTTTGWRGEQPSDLRVTVEV